jgi:hypothetical protein
MSRKTWIWIVFGLLLAMFAVIQFIPDANAGQTEREPVSTALR